MFDVIHTTKRIENVVFVIHFDDLITKEKHVVVNDNEILKLFIDFRSNSFRWIVWMIKMWFRLIQQSMKLSFHFSLKHLSFILCKIVK